MQVKLNGPTEQIQFYRDLQLQWINVITALNFLWNEFFMDQLNCSIMMLLQWWHEFRAKCWTEQQNANYNKMFCVSASVCCLEFNIPSQILCFLIVLDLELGEMPSCAGTLLVCYEWHNSPLIWKFIVRNRKLLCFWSVCYAVV